MALYWEYTGYTGGYACSGDTEGIEIILNGSQTNYTYELYKNGSQMSPRKTKSGTGQALTPWYIKESGNYTVRAFRPGLSNWTYTNIDIYWNTKPVVRTMTGGGIRYNDYVGVEVGLDWSGPSRISYELYRNGIFTGIEVPGTEAELSFGLLYSAGTYTSKGYVVNTSNSQYVSGGLITTGLTYYRCYSDMDGTATIIVYPSPTVTTDPITRVETVTSPSNSDVNIPLTYTIQSGASLTELRIIINYDFHILKYVNCSYLMPDATCSNERGVITIDWSSVSPSFDVTKEVAIMVFNYKIGDTEISIGNNTFYKFYGVDIHETIKQNGYVYLADDRNGSLSAYKTIANGVGAVLYAPDNYYYDIFFDDVFFGSIKIDQVYKHIYKADARKITIRGALNRLTRLDLSNNNFENLEVYYSDFYRLTTLNLQNNKFKTFAIPNYANTFDFRNNQLSLESTNTLFKKCYDSGIYNAILDLRDNFYIDTNNQYYKALLLKGWTILT